MAVDLPSRGFNRVTMATKLERLEKLFSKRKHTAGSHGHAASKKSAAPLPSPDAESRTFPEPSFIRPTSSRMMAREEVVFKPHPKLRSKSLPESSNATTVRITTPAPRSLRHVPAVPAPYTSMVPRTPQGAPIYATARRGDPSEAFANFSFPAQTDEALRSCRPQSTSRSRHLTPPTSPRTRADLKRDSAAAQLEPSLSPLKLNCQPEPECDCRSPTPGSITHELRDFDPSVWPKPRLNSDRRHTLMVTTPNDPNRPSLNLSRRPLSVIIPSPAARRTLKTLRQPPSMSRPTKRKSLGVALKEPTVDDFLALSDDDIADSNNVRAQTPGPCLPPFAAHPSTHPTLFRSPVWTSPVHPMVTLSPPLAARPAADAAIAAAKIAAKYRLNLLYVVNLWPSHMSRPSRSSPFDGAYGSRAGLSTHDLSFGALSPPESPMSQSSGDDSSGGFDLPRRGPGLAITGRLLAAYNLDTVQSPFRISVPANLKALRANDWLEFRNDRAAPDEYAVGYSRAFYTGYSPARGGKGPLANRRPSTPDDGASRGFWPPPNRGIVFSAFRAADEHGNVILSNQEELQEMYRDVEALVNMLVDTHKRQRYTCFPKSTPRRRCVNGSGGRMTQPQAARAA
ncbi:hypothetical protein VTJ83DRAFT_2442 [Remersonia thermophila]|uniref:Uncharacterized protein n=1 Tax=Remersonia thermophila TaxID=72144 RepID=A0ABR4DIS2_9PEZI